MSDPGPIVFPLYTFAAIYIVTVAHELSHAAAGALAGLRIAACGVGFRKPLFKFRLFGTVFYQTRSPFGGLTLACPKRGLGSPRAFAAMIAAGPLSDSVITVIALTLWLRGFTWPWIVPLLFVAGAFSLTGLVPHSISVRGTQLRNDMSLFIATLRRRTHSIADTTQTLHSQCVLRDLSREIDAWPQVIASTLGIAVCQADLGDVEGAKRSLEDPVLSDPRRGDLLRDVESIDRAVIAAAVRDPSAPAQLARAAEVAREHPSLVLALRLLESEFAAGHGQPVAEILEQISQDALRLGDPQILNAAQAVQWQIAPPDDPLHAYEWFVSRKGGLRPFPLLQLHAAKTMVRALAERRQTELARYMFQRAMALVRSIAARIPLEETRERFLVQNSRELHQAVLKLDGPDDIPLYVNPLVQEAPPTRSRIWTLAAGIAIGLILGFAASLAALLAD